MADVKTKDFNEYLLENIQAAREETREFKNDINKRMDRIELRMDKLENKIDVTRQELNQRMDKMESRMDKMDEKIDKLAEKLDSSMKEIRDLVAASQKDIRSSERHSQILTSTIVSIVIVVLYSILNH